MHKTDETGRTNYAVETFLCGKGGLVRATTLIDTPVAVSEIPEAGQAALRSFIAQTMIDEIQANGRRVLPEGRKALAQQIEAGLVELT